MINNCWMKSSQLAAPGKTYIRFWNIFDFQILKSHVPIIYLSLRRDNNLFPKEASMDIHLKVISTYKEHSGDTSLTPKSWKYIR